MAIEKPKGWLDKYASNVAASDATRVSKQLTPLNANKVTQRELNEREAQLRRDRIAKANAAKDKMYTNPDEPIFGFSPEVFAESTSAIGDKLRTSEYPNVFDDYLNPIPFFGDLASGLGQIPLNLKQRDYRQAALNTLAPILAGAGERAIGSVAKGLSNKKIGKHFNGIITKNKPLFGSNVPKWVDLSTGELKKGNEYLYYGEKALGKEMGVASDKELKEAYEEAMDKLKPRELETIRDYGMINSKALTMDMRLKFADRMKMFTDPNAIDNLEGGMGTDIRDIYSNKFLKDQGYDVSKLTPQDRALMHGYARGYDSFFNKRSWDVVPNYTSPEILQYYDDISNQLNTAAQKNKLITDKTFNRTFSDYPVDLLDVSTNQKINTVNKSGLQKGDVFRDEEFMSTSLPHYKYNDNANLERIIAPGGNKQSFLFPNSMRSTPYGNENEVILPKGLIRRVEEVNSPEEITTSILNPYKNGGWLEKYDDGGPIQPNYNDYSVSAPEGFEGEGYSNVGRNYSPAWGGQFAMGGALPGATGHMYARVGAPSKGPHRNQTDVTDASAQNGAEMKYYQNGLDWKPKSISRDGDNVAYADNTRVGNVPRYTRPSNYQGNQPDTLGENIFEIVDPSGISSWDDIYRSYNQTGMSGQTAMEAVGAIPMLGKLKKAGQFLDIVSKAVPMTGRQAKNVKNSVTALKVAGKYGPSVGRATDAYQAYDQYKQGGQLTKLDQLLNFTNYNTKQPGDWLDKYNN
jgi:hypothetical protein